MQPMTPEQIADMYGDIPQERFIDRTTGAPDVVKIGQSCRAEFVSEVSEGVYNEADRRGGQPPPL